MKRVKSVAIDANLLEEAEREAAKRGVAFSALVEEALRLYLNFAPVEKRLIAVEERLAALEALLEDVRRRLEKTDDEKGVGRKESPAPPLPSAGSPLASNVWVDILRKRDQRLETVGI